jgi:hypothetical protein
MGFNYFHGMTMYDGRRMPKQNEAIKQGWYTTAWSRSFLLNKFTDAIRGGWYKPNSPMLIRELAVFERKIGPTGKEVLIAQEGKKDDNLFAGALSYISRHDIESLSERQQKRYSRPTGRLPQIDYSHATSNQVSIGDW